MTPLVDDRPVLVGRSSSHFTRVARIFAHELGVAHDFHVVRDLLSTEPASYGGNPALRIPSLRTARADWFGALNVCRELARRSTKQLRILWPESFADPLLANAQELVLQAMATEVTLVMSKLSGAAVDAALPNKLRASLVGTMTWLEEHAGRIRDALPPDRDLSFLEVSLYCLVTHLRFRDVLPLDAHASLDAFSADFGARASAAATTYRFDS